MLLQEGAQDPASQAGMAVFRPLRRGRGGLFLHSREERREWGHLGPQQVRTHRFLTIMMPGLLLLKQHVDAPGCGWRGVPCR